MPLFESVTTLDMGANTRSVDQTAVDESLSRYSDSWNRELLLLSLLLGCAHLILWLLGLPLPHIDFNGYVDPAVNLARTGHLVSPAAQHGDLTSMLGFYYVPPVHFLAVAAWIRTVGESPSELLGLTLLLHQIWLTGLWILLRRRFACSLAGASMGVICSFPFFNHGRPDLLCHCLSTFSWVMIASSGRWNWIGAGTLLGLAIGTAPQFGGTAGLAIAAHLLTRATGSRRQEWYSLLSYAAVAAAAAILVTVGMALQQGKLDVAWIQYRNHMRLRGGDFNVLPSVLRLYDLVFVGVGLGMLTLIPALAVWFDRPSRGATTNLRPAAAAYLAGWVAWMLAARGYFLAWAHFAFLGQSVLHGQMISTTLGWIRRLAWVMTGGYAALHFYFGKATFWGGTSSVGNQYAAIRAIPANPREQIAVDYFTFGALVQHTNLLHYELMQWRWWPKYLAATPNEVINLLPQRDQTRASLPDRIIVTSGTLHREGWPDPATYRMVSGNPTPEPVVVWGRKLSLLANPLEACVFERVIAKSSTNP